MTFDDAAAGPRPIAYALLAAGSGTRMGPLTSDRAKVLVEVDGRAILEHNLRAIAMVEPGAAVAVIAGYRAETVAAFVRNCDVDVAAEVLVNADYARSGPLRSLRLAIERFSGRVEALTIGNGDTIFEPAALAALAASDADVALLVSEAEPGDGDPDDVQVKVEGGRIRAAAKRLAAPGALAVSAGLLGIRGETALGRVGASVEALIAEEDRSGRSFTWHSVIAALAEDGAAAEPVQVPARWWCEFDSGDCIDRYLARRAPAPRR